jgi:hypothetical protein
VMNSRTCCGASSTNRFEVLTRRTKFETARGGGPRPYPRRLLKALDHLERWCRSSVPAASATKQDPADGAVRLLANQAKRHPRHGLFS